MATLTVVSPSIAGAVVTPEASTPAGDVVPWNGGDLLLKFINGHTETVTVTIAPTKTSAVVPNVGGITVPTRSLALDQDEEGVIFIPRDQAGAYVNTSMQIPLGYTSGNAALTVLALSV